MSGPKLPTGNDPESWRLTARMCREAAAACRRRGEVLDAIDHLKHAAEAEGYARSGDRWRLTLAGRIALRHALRMAVDADRAAYAAGRMCRHCGTHLAEPARYCGPACAAASYAATAGRDGTRILEDSEMAEESSDG